MAIKIHHKKQSLWRRLIYAKYNQDFLGDFPVKDKYSSSRSIIKGVDWFSPLYTWKFNIGDSVSFWKGTWNNKSLLVVYALRLFALSDIQQASVKDMWNSTTSNWDLQPRRPLRSFELHFWNSLKIKFSIPNQSHGPDFPTWKRNSNRHFDIASIKKVIMSIDANDVSSINPTTFKPLWQSSIHKKCKFYIWSLLHECINTAGKLQKRLPYWNLNPNWCPLCKNHLKNIDHLFITCPYSQDLWKKTFDTLKWRYVITNLAALCKDLYSIKSDNRKRTITFNTIDVTLWVIWLERNKRIFKGLKRTSMEDGMTFKLIQVFGLVDVSSSLITVLALSL